MWKEAVLEWVKRWWANREHRHYWRLMDVQQATVLTDPDKELKGMLRVEGCWCGAVRQIEFYPGRDPVIREAVRAKVGGESRAPGSTRS